MNASIPSPNRNPHQHRRLAGAGRAAMGSTAAALPQIYEKDINIAIWQRKHSASFNRSVDQLLKLHSEFSFSLMTNSRRTRASVRDSLPKNYRGPLADDVTELVDMFCCLFDLTRVGLRLEVLEQAMCPRFHVDMVPCRLVTTYAGPATEWLADEDVDRTKLGEGSRGLADDSSGLYGDPKDIKILTCGDVALLKGGAWVGNEGSELVHRSPSVASGERRLLLTIDYGR